MGIKKQPDSINETRAVVKNVEQNRTTSLIWSADHAPNPLTRVGSLSCVEHCGDILINGAAAGGQACRADDQSAVKTPLGLSPGTHCRAAACSPGAPASPLSPEALPGFFSAADVDGTTSLR